MDPQVHSFHFVVEEMEVKAPQSVAELGVEARFPGSHLSLSAPYHAAPALCLMQGFPAKSPDRAFKIDFIV